MIGGSVALIGKPTAAAVPVTPNLLGLYNEWLFYERRMLCIEQYGERQKPSVLERYIPTSSNEFHFPLGVSWRDVPKPSTRAATVMAAVGADLGYPIEGETIDDRENDRTPTRFWTVPLNKAL